MADEDAKKEKEAEDKKDEAKKEDTPAADAEITLEDANDDKDAESDGDGSDDADGDGKKGKKGKKGGSKKKIIMIAVAALLVLGGGGAAAFFLLAGNEEPKEVAPVVVPPVYIDFPEVVVDLQSTSRRTNYIKLTLSFKIPKDQEKQLLEAQPLILDSFRSYLRGLSRKEVSGKQGTEILRAELVRLAKEAAPGIDIQKILFKDIMVN